MTGNDWFPLHFGRLRKSKWWRRASDLARARNVMLWGEAYKSVPAGSLPDDDDELAEAAGFGMDVEAFLAVKEEIMAPWTLCRDGRWYHPTVCEVVLDTWERSSAQRKKAAVKKAAQRARARGQGGAEQHVPPKSADVPATDAHVPRDRGERGGDIDTQRAGLQDKTGQDRTEPPYPPGGDGQNELDLDGGETADPPDPVETAVEAWNEMARRLGLPVAKTLDAARRKRVATRLKSAGPQGWADALRAVERSAFCRGLRQGRDGRTFRADLDFVCQATSFARLIDGFYGEDAPTKAPKPPTDAKPWEGPAEVRAAIEWGLREYAATYLARCAWRDVPESALVTTSGAAYDRIRRDAGAELARLGVKLVLEQGEAA